jgi:hypothetical protein
MAVFRANRRPYGGGAISVSLRVLPEPLSGIEPAHDSRELNVNRGVASLQPKQVAAQTAQGPLRSSVASAHHCDIEVYNVNSDIRGIDLARRNDASSQPLRARRSGGESNRKDLAVVVHYDAPRATAKITTTVPQRRYSSGRFLRVVYGKPVTSRCSGCRLRHFHGAADDNSP